MFIYLQLFTHLYSWQPRWFVLEGGTLSYYDSQEDVWKGCKGSIRVCVCEIKGQAQMRKT
uniref:PH domain-containing protein n=1 Tax=Scleropages formosus TaxID=113540 RepID=A0A8C9RW01_SCLFO